MARDTQSIVKMSRREGYALHPKAHKALAKRTAKPGANANSRMRSKPSQYALQLREKQKVKRLYGLLEKQFSNLMAEANRTEGQSGVTLLQNLEPSLDSPSFLWANAAVRDACHISNTFNLDADCLHSANSCIAAKPDALNKDVHFAQAIGLLCKSSCFFSSNLGSISRAFFAAAEPASSRT
jgi:hypothetical protein